MRTEVTQLEQLQQNVMELSDELVSVNGELVGALREIEQLKARI